MSTVNRQHYSINNLNNKSCIALNFPFETWWYRNSLFDLRSIFIVTAPANHLFW